MSQICILKDKWCFGELQKLGALTKYERDLVAERCKNEVELAIQCEHYLCKRHLCDFLDDYGRKFCKYCKDPFKSHKSKVKKGLSKAKCGKYSSLGVDRGDLVCKSCVKKLSSDIRVDHQLPEKSVNTSNHDDSNDMELDDDNDEPCSQEVKDNTRRVLSALGMSLISTHQTKSIQFREFKRKVDTGTRNMHQKLVVAGTSVNSIANCSSIDANLSDHYSDQESEFDAVSYSASVSSGKSTSSDPGDHELKLSDYKKLLDRLM